MTDKMDAALRYVGLGWFVYPLNWITDGRCSCGDPDCKNPGKHPKTTHGHLDASDEPARITMWWTGRPDANIGISLEASHIQVVDVDPQNGGDATFEALPEPIKAQIRDTLTIRTGGGGWHYIFRCNGTDTIRDLGRGIDVKQRGGIVAPPSNHVSGGIYEHVNPGREIADPPKSLIVAVGAGPQPLPEEVFEGSRHKDARSLAMSIANRGVSVSVVMAAIKERSEEAYDPPLRDKELRAMARSAVEKAGKRGLQPGEMTKRLGFRVLSVTQFTGDVEEILLETSEGPVNLGRISNLINLRGFRSAIAKSLHRLPNYMSGAKWNQIAQVLVEMIKDVHVAEATALEILKVRLERYAQDSDIVRLTDMRHEDEGKAGWAPRVVFAREDGRLCVNASDLCLWVRAHDGEKVTVKAMAMLLGRLKCEHQRAFSNGGRRRNVWWLPLEVTDEWTWRFAGIS